MPPTIAPLMQPLAAAVSTCANNASAPAAAMDRSSLMMLSRFRDADDRFATTTDARQFRSAPRVAAGLTESFPASLMAAEICGQEAHSMADQGKAAFVGRSIKRREDQRLLTGKGLYIADLTLPHMLHAVFVRSGAAHARIRAVDL